MMMIIMLVVVLVITMMMMMPIVACCERTVRTDETARMKRLRVVCVQVVGRADESRKETRRVEAAEAARLAGGKKTRRRSDAAP